MLTPQDLVLLREALAYWAMETVGLDRLQATDQTHSECLVEVTETDIQRLFQRLMPENIRYIVVDRESNHTVNTRLFRKAPHIHASSDRWQVKQVTEASKGLVTADAEARKGWVAAQQSFEQTRKSIVQQQTDIQSGLDRLESERKSIATQRATDLLLSGSIEAIGTVVAVLVPLLLLGWLMQRFWQTDSVQDVDEMIVMSAKATQIPPTVSMTEIWKNLKPVSIANGRYLPEVLDDDSWSHDA